MSQVTAAAVAEPAVLVDVIDAIESSIVARVAVTKNSTQRTLVFNSDRSLGIGDAAVDVLAVPTAGTNQFRSHSEDPLQAAKVAHQLKLQAQAAEYRKDYLLHPRHVEISKYKDTGQVSTLTGRTFSKIDGSLKSTIFILLTGLVINVKRVFKK